MDIRFKPQFTEDDVKSQIDAEMQKFYRQILNILSYTGYQFVKNARSKAPSVGWHKDAPDLLVAAKLAGASLSLSQAGSFNDQTGNLRSSIGFIILQNGQIIKSHFPITLGGADGVAAGEAVASELRLEYPSGFVLVLVAGMEYASFVEAKGYDVISGSAITAKSQLAKYLKRLR